MKLTIEYIRAIQDIEYLEQVVKLELPDYYWVTKNIEFVMGEIPPYINKRSPLELLRRGVTQEKLDSLLKDLLKEINSSLVYDNDPS
jgi:hypothetical protein